ncbi:unnamed protein product [Cuscuta campestris]|uniref:Uncharacterized protein n=1 Tax=Cuscuta campestris TaxID=132261 RepID=A0A484KE90_9ASTE|nr:unnamed protein product [Cuscuta campestris]
MGAYGVFSSTTEDLACVGSTGTGNTTTVAAASKSGVTQTTHEINLGGSSVENEATGSASPVKETDSNTAGAATPTVSVDAMATKVPAAITPPDSFPATSVSVDSVPNVCDDRDNVEKVSDAILPKSCTEAYPDVKKIFDGCEVTPTVNCPAACGNSEVILATPTNVQDDTPAMEPNSPLPYNNEHCCNAHNLSSEAELADTHTVDTYNNEEFNSDHSPINLKEFPVLTKELLEATSGEHNYCLEKEMERTLSPSCAGNEETHSDPMENNNSPPLLTNDAGSLQEKSNILR